MNIKGFTLVELLVTVAIVGILASIAMVNYEEFRMRAYYADMEVTARNWMTAQQGYLINHTTRFGSHCNGTTCNLPGMTFSDDTCTDSQFIFHNKVSDRSVYVLLVQPQWFTSSYGLNICNNFSSF